LQVHGFVRVASGRIGSRKSAPGGLHGGSGRGAHLVVLQAAHTWGARRRHHANAQAQNLVGADGGPNSHSFRHYPQDSVSTTSPRRPDGNAYCKEQGRSSLFRGGVCPSALNLSRIGSHPLGSGARRTTSMQPMPGPWRRRLQPQAVCWRWA
jgi:hypothetical protein